jgi:DHA1 family bicyclomycin/chloramphenicol resistance-like MFS transporter
MRLGMRRLSHAALLGFIVVAAVHLAVAGSHHETLVVFAAFQALSMFCYGLCSGNFGAMAMEPMGHIAGTASAFQGFVSMVGASLIGFVIGQAFNGTVLPLEAGYLLCGLCTLASVLTAERGQLFRPHAIGAAPEQVVEKRA